MRPRHRRARINDEVEPGLEAICLKALRKSPEDRYLSASELAQDMQRWLADEPGAGLPRHPGPAVLCAGLAGTRRSWPPPPACSLPRPSPWRSAPPGSPSCGTRPRHRASRHAMPSSC